MRQFKYICLLVLTLFSIRAFSQTITSSSIRFLALGDSYTIGEGVQEAERWPNQLVKELSNKGIATDELTVIARTGWTTDNLLGFVGANNPDSNYSLVSLLIGVNNQFQGRNINTYREEFRRLLEIAVMKCGGRKEGVFVLSIPDYGYTPFGWSQQKSISAEIDEYNAINKQITIDMGIAYYDITPSSREAINKPSYLARDQLHPSGEMYKRWVDLVLNDLSLDVITSLAGDIIEATKPKAYPNPTQGLFTVELPENAEVLEVYNMRGEKTGQWFAKEKQQLNINTSDWVRGVYFYRITDGLHTRHTGKIVIE